MKETEYKKFERKHNTNLTYEVIPNSVYCEKCKNNFDEDYGCVLDECGSQTDWEDKDGNEEKYCLKITEYLGEDLGDNFYGHFCSENCLKEYYKSEVN